MKNKIRCDGLIVPWGKAFSCLDYLCRLVDSEFGLSADFADKEEAVVSLTWKKVK